MPGWRMGGCTKPVGHSQILNSSQKFHSVWGLLALPICRSPWSVIPSRYRSRFLQRYYALLRFSTNKPQPPTRETPKIQVSHFPKSPILKPDMRDWISRTINEKAPFSSITSVSASLVSPRCAAQSGSHPKRRRQTPPGATPTGYSASGRAGFAIPGSSPGGPAGQGNRSPRL